MASHLSQGLCALIVAAPWRTRGYPTCLSLPQPPPRQPGRFDALSFCRPVLLHLSPRHLSPSLIRTESPRFDPARFASVNTLVNLDRLINVSLITLLRDIAVTGLDTECLSGPRSATQRDAVHKPASRSSHVNTLDAPYRPPEGVDVLSSGTLAGPAGHLLPAAGRPRRPTRRRRDGRRRRRRVHPRYAVKSVSVTTLLVFRRS